MAGPTPTAAELLLKRTAVALIPIPCSLVGKLFLESHATAMVDVRDWHFYNFSMDMLITAFGILIGPVLLGEEKTVPDWKEIARSFMIWCFAFLLILTFGSLLPSLEVFDRDNIWIALVVPSMLGLGALAFAVREVG